MTRLHISPLDKTIEADPADTVLDAIRRAGIDIASPCGGQHLCGKCKIRIDGPVPAPVSPDGHLNAEEVANGIRLACQTRVQDGMRIHLPADYSPDIRILENDRIRRYRLAPAAAIREAAGRFELVYRGRPPTPLENWHHQWVPRGMAIDLGTTTLVATLMDLHTGELLSTASAVNPQTRFGHDVLTRIQKASTDAGLAELSGVITAAVNDLIRQACNDAGASPLEIVDTVIGGNTAMIEIAAGINPAPLGRVPFTVDIDSGQVFEAGRFRFDIHPDGRVYIPPVAHAFVGADVSAGLLSIDFFEDPSPVLFIDMGTNGEMALTAGGQRIVTSTAAGPAFEGMGISHGMAAAPGAIESVRTDGTYISVRTVNDDIARGICGSGIIDLVACLLDTGTMDAGGRLTPHRRDSGRSGPFDAHCETVDGVTAVRLTESVRFTQKDVRQFQLAKSAIRTGMDLLLSSAGVTAGQLETMVIAGAFGYHLREESLRRIGLVPEGFAGEIQFAGNTCRTGCIRLLMDASARDILRHRMAGVRHLSIADAPDFQDRFIANMAFPG